jgi:SAM-dependent methyltransferase
VVAGIPILKKGPIGNLDETANHVSALIKSGRYREALLCMIMPPSPPSPTLAPAWLRSLPSARGVRRIQRLVHQRAAHRWREQAESFLTQSENHLSACSLLDFYYRKSGYKWDGAYEYFGLRFGQPRHLVALSFTTLIDNPKRPILDLACGFGHVTRSLASRSQGQPVIGVDQTFVGLYVAKNYIAPEAHYVCSNADGPLPFTDGVFSAAFCTDAFHYLVNKVTASNELKRLTRDNGIIVLTWVHNVNFRKPNDGVPLPPEGYKSLVADMPHRMVDDSDVLARYLRKKGPALARSCEPERLAQAPLLSLVASRRQDVFKDYESFDGWPHANGRLGLNPLYMVDRRDSDVQLRRTFPSASFVEEHSELKDYLPELVSVRSETLTDLANGNRTPEVDTLVGLFVALGMPDRYQ